MAKYQIFTDSCSDMTPEMRYPNNIDYFRMVINVRGEDLEADLDYKTYSAQEIYDWIEDLNNKCKTSLIQVGEFIKRMRPYLEKGIDVFYIAVTSVLSGSYNTFRFAKEELEKEFPDRKIVAYNSTRAGMALGMMVLDAAKMQQEGKEIVCFGGIDNVLLKVVDPLFIGMMVDNKMEIASKSAFKEIAQDPIGVFCKINNRPGILGYEHITEELSNQKDEQGKYLYREVNILTHLFSIKALEKLQDIELPYHRTFKKNAFLNYEGVKEVPLKPNSFKFEKFIFDAFAYFDDMLLLRVNEEEEFAPIKDFTGIYNPETAKIKYVNYWKKQGIKIEYED